MISDKSLFFKPVLMVRKKQIQRFIKCSSLTLIFRIIG